MFCWRDLDFLVKICLQSYTRHFGVMCGSVIKEAKTNAMIEKHEIHEAVGVDSSTADNNWFYEIFYFWKYVEKAVITKE